MPRKIDISTVEGARKALELAIERHADAKVARSWAGLGPPHERQALIKDVSDTRKAMFHAIDHFEEIVRGTSN